MARRQFSIKISVFFTSKKKETLEKLDGVFDIPKTETAKKNRRKLQLPATLASEE